MNSSCISRYVDSKEPRPDQSGRYCIISSQSVLVQFPNFLLFSLILAGCRLCCMWPQLLPSHHTHHTPTNHWLVPSSYLSVPGSWGRVLGWSGSTVSASWSEPCLSPLLLTLIRVASFHNHKVQLEMLRWQVFITIFFSSLFLCPVTKYFSRPHLVYSSGQPGKIKVCLTYYKS